MKHYSVLKKEALESLNLKSDGVYVDATLGYAGHSSEILKVLDKGFLYAFDSDEEAIQYSKEVLENISNQFHIFHANFSEMKEKLNEQDVEKVDGILFDLGVSSPQIDSETRGFSFMREEVLDMRMDQSKGASAKEIVNQLSEEELTKIFYRYGEEARSKLIARKIVEQRKEKEIVTTTELVEIIKSAVGANYFYKQHPERKIFQAIRIQVNDELSVLEKVLPEAIDLLKVGGRIVVITFHSLEDRIVKQIFKEKSELDEMVKGLPVIPDEYKKELKVLTKKPIVASEKELTENSRSKSAKLRVAERI